MAAPTRDSIGRMTSTMRSAMSASTRSPARIFVEGFADDPFMRTWPPSHNRVASGRVFTRRTAHSQRSMRVSSVAIDQSRVLLSAIIHLVEEAQEQKGRGQQFIERFSRIHSPALLLYALALAVVPVVLGGEPEEWVTRAITVIVAGAPCALVMSTPVAMAAGIGTGGRRGVLIKGVMHLENLGLLRVVALDKTGRSPTADPRSSTSCPSTGSTPLTCWVWRRRSGSRGAPRRECPATLDGLRRKGPGRHTPNTRRLTDAGMCLPPAADVLGTTRCPRGRRWPAPE